MRNSLLCASIYVSALLAACPLNTMATADPDPNPGPPLAPDSIVVDEVPGKPAYYGPTPPAPRSIQAGQPQGTLSGRIVFTSGGHGWNCDGNTAWNTDRPVYNNVLEDVGNQDQVTMYADYCFRAGATVVSFRPIGNQTNEVIVDNTAATFTGSWIDSSSNPHYGTGTPAYRYAAAADTESATARYTPNIPQAGYYPVYTWVLNSSNRCVDQLYRIAHTGGTSEVRVNHRKVGRGWVYLGTYYFNSGTGGYVEISNQSGSPASSNAIADAIRFGNGMGTIADGTPSVTSGKTREDEAGMYWGLAGLGVGGDTSVYTGVVGTPPRGAAYMNDSTQGVDTDRVYVGFHSNGGGTTARGVVGLWNNDADFPGTKTPNQLRLAQLLATEVNSDLVGLGTLTSDGLTWFNRTSGLTYARSDYAFGEIRDDSIDGEMDATIVEVAFHDNVTDAELLRESKVRQALARSCYQGTLRYFGEFGGATVTFLPDAPTNVRAIANASNVTVSWNAPASGGALGGAATGYLVYQSSDGYGFGNPVTVTGGTTLQHTFSGVTQGQVKYYRVSATNAGGESLPTEVVAVRPGSAASQILVVNGFDRLDRSMDPVETQGARTGIHRVKPWKCNSYDYVVQHAKALHAANMSFDSTSNEAVQSGQVVLTGRTGLVWILGEEGSNDLTFNPTEQSLVTNYMNAGGSLFVSGAEIGWDLDQANHGRTFYRNILHATYTADDAGTYTGGAGSGSLTGIAAGAISFAAMGQNATAFPPINAAPYDAEFCDVIAANAAATPCLQYSTGSVAGIQYAGDSRVIHLAVPFECIVSSAVRDSIMTKAAYLLRWTYSAASDWTLY